MTKWISREKKYLCICHAGDLFFYRKLLFYFFLFSLHNFISTQFRTSPELKRTVKEKKKSPRNQFLVFNSLDIALLVDNIMLANVCNLFSSQRRWCWQLTSDRIDAFLRSVIWKNWNYASLTQTYTEDKKKCQDWKRTGEKK